MLPLSFSHVNVPYSGIVPVTSKAVARVRLPVCHTPLDFQWIFVCATDWPPAQAVLIADSYGAAVCTVCGVLCSTVCWGLHNQAFSPSIVSYVSVCDRILSQPWVGHALPCTWLIKSMGCRCGWSDRMDNCNLCTHQPLAHSWMCYQPLA